MCKQLHTVFTLSEVSMVGNGRVRRLLLPFSHSKVIDVCAALFAAQDSLVGDSLLSQTLDLPQTSAFAVDHSGFKDNHKI